MEKEDSFPQRVWQIVAAIPEGYVTTYGDVAKLAGSPRAARQALLAEGVMVSGSGQIDLQRYRWNY